jgi:hypothetical protein
MRGTGFYFLRKALHLGKFAFSHKPANLGICVFMKLIQLLFTHQLIVRSGADRNPLFIQFLQLSPS